MIAELWLGMERESKKPQRCSGIQQRAAPVLPWHLAKNTTDRSAVHIVSACQQGAGSFPQGPT